MGSNRQRVAQITSQSIKTWPSASHAPINNARICSAEIEELIVYLCRENFEDSYNLTAKHVGMITGQGVSAHLVQRVRARNGLEKAWPWRAKRKIKSSYNHVVSVDVVRENGKHIFGYIQDDTKLVFHYHAKAQTAAEAVNGLKIYIQKHGRPEAVRSDNGSEFKGEFIQFLKETKESEKPIAHLRPKPYNPRANGFIERYFRTLRQDLFRKTTGYGQKVDQNTLDDFAVLWNHFRIVGKTGKTPAELAGAELRQEDLNRFKFTKETVSGWTFWHVEGINGLHAYLREEKLPNMELTQRQKIA